jgi:hypothetical protein
MPALGFSVPPLDNTLGAVFLGGAIAAMCVINYLVMGPHTKPFLVCLE